MKNNEKNFIGIAVAVILLCISVALNRFAITKNRDKINEIQKSYFVETKAEESNTEVSTSENANTDEILPCPICGGKAEVMFIKNNDEVSAWMKCMDCKLHTDYLMVKH